MKIWQPVYVGIGSNLQEPVTQVQSGIEELAQIRETILVISSGLVKSAPLGNMQQPDYVNAVAGLLTLLAPEPFLNELQRIELAHGRTRGGQRWAPRTLDLDILVFGNLETGTERLTIPHPHMCERSFVLGPLEAIAPHLHVPGYGTVHALAKSIKPGDVQPCCSAQVAPA